MKYGATCEYHPLRKVLMFRPGEEISKITIHSFQEFTFRDVVYWKRFQEEHDKFSAFLQRESIEVIYLNDLLDDNEKRIVNPNSVFTRDAGTVTSSGSIQMLMANQIRTLEPTLVTRGLKKLGIPLLHAITSPGLLEGGDFVYPDEKTLMIGYRTRSNEEGALQATKSLFDSSIVETVVLVPLPSWRVHLDGGLMFIDKDLFLYHPASVESFPVKVQRKNEEVGFMPLMDFIEETFDAEKIAITDNELYLFGANVVCLNKRKCVIYEWNERVIKELEDRNVEVIPIEGGELARGGGGPHCMTLPILRQK
ncbi:MAG: dimethylarginine dimethylaminohydrolase family protein [Candidatus Hodarchaeales archaeon]|jgi:arginine deiminase